MSKSLIAFTKKKFTKVFVQEIAVWSKELKVAGRLDGFVLYNGVPTLADFKTSKKKKSGTQIRDYYLQASFYVYALNELCNLKIKDFVILVIVEDGTVQEFCGKAIHYIPELRYRVKQYYSHVHKEN